MKTANWRFCPAVLLIVLLGGGIPAQASAQFLPPPPPLAPHPDSSGVVVAAQATSLLAASVLLEEAMRGWIAAEDPQDHHTLSRLGNFLGRGPTMAFAVAGVYGGARVAGIEEVSTPAGRTLAALMVAGAANGMLKFAVGRGRPGSAGRAEFRPLATDDGWQSFPSGHAVTAFALAAAIAEQADRSWVTYSSYSAATLVGWSRIHEGRHWASDVVAGALIGSFAARTTVRRLEARAARAGAARAGVHPVNASLPRLVLHPLPGGFAVSIHPR